MSRRMAVRAAFIGVCVLALGPISGLVQNVASAEAKWPGPLDYLRQHAWWFLGGTTVILVMLYLLDRFWAGQDPPTGSPSRTIDMSRSTFNAPVTLAQGDATPAVGVSSTPIGDVEQPANELINQTPIILYAVSPFLDNGSWEAKAVLLTRAVNPKALCVQLDDQNLSVQGVAVIVLIFSSAQYTAVKKRTLAKLRSAKAHYPSVRLILIAAGLADEPIKDEDGHNLLKSAGYSMDHARFLICATEDDFQLSLSLHLRLAIDVRSMQSILDDARPNPVADQEIEP